MKYAFIEQEKGNSSVRTLCRALQVSPSGFYEWQQRRGQPDRRKRANEDEVRKAITRLHCRSRGRYGRPRLVACLRAEGLYVGPNRVRRIMNEIALSGRAGIKRRRQKKPTAKVAAAPNRLRRNFRPRAPNLVWTGDITVIAVGSAKLYLAVVIDLYSRELVGWKLDTRMKAGLVTEALKSAVRRRKPKRDLIFHSDQGSQYSAERFRTMLRLLGFRQSMSRRGNCWDNAPTESFFATLKKELVYTRPWRSREQLARAIERYIAFYNSERLHSTLGLRSPKTYDHRRAA
jgi:transposase InsO family protein